MKNENPFAVAVVLVHGERALGLRRAPSASFAAGVWETVSGGVKPGETLLEAAGREVHEETGQTVSIEPRPVDAYLFQRGPQATALVVFRAIALSTEVRCSPEHDAHAWWSIAAFQQANTPPRLIQAITTALGSG